ncbi:hypothetical protein J6590_021481 [Homalodisca vitripennis]|nr:hypothetical protein J6590_021481 [Homalodisca vitripennis]
MARRRGAQALLRTGTAICLNPSQVPKDGASVPSNLRAANISRSQPERNHQNCWNNGLIVCSSWTDYS